MESMVQVSLAQEVIREVSPVTPRIYRLSTYSSPTSPLSGLYSGDQTPIHSPRRRRRREPIPFNVLVVGFIGSGKTRLVEFLCEQLDMVRDQRNSVLEEAEKSEDHWAHGFTRYYVDADVKGERVAVTLWDSRGFGASRDDEIVDLQMDEIVMFVQNKFEDTFSEETKVKRLHKYIDTHIHCVFYLMDPTSPYLREKIAMDAVDISIIRRLSKYTIVIPVISKVDTCTKQRITEIKSALRKGMEENGIKILEFLGNDECCEEVSADGSILHQGGDEMYDFLPFGCMVPDREQNISLSMDKKMFTLNLCREYPWGMANPLDDKHCDFIKLKDMVFGEWRNEMREFCKEVLYENWRTDRLQKLGDISLKMMKSEI